MNKQKKLFQSGNIVRNKRWNHSREGKKSSRKRLREGTPVCYTWCMHSKCTYGVHSAEPETINKPPTPPSCGGSLARRAEKRSLRPCTAACVFISAARCCISLYPEAVVEYSCYVFPPADYCIYSSLLLRRGGKQYNKR